MLWPLLAFHHPVQVSQESGFSAASVFFMLALDVLLYSALVWYCDKAGAATSLACSTWVRQALASAAVAAHPLQPLLLAVTCCGRLLAAGHGQP